MFLYTLLEVQDGVYAEVPCYYLGVEDFARSKMQLSKSSVAHYGGHMAGVTKIDPTTSSGEKRQRSDVRFPARSLADSVAVADAINKQGGGRATADQVAAFLGYKNTQNGAYLARIGAARTFGLITKSGDFFVTTPLATQILMPTYPEQGKQGLADAFLSVELFRLVYEEFKGRELPPEFGMKNALKNIFKVMPTRVDVAYRTLMDSAQDAGFFDTRGSRTHLIMPSVQAAPPMASYHDSQAAEVAHGGGGSGSEISNPLPGGLKLPPTNLDAVKARYVQALINALEEKSKKGELDSDLMARIEKLLGH